MNPFLVIVHIVLLIVVVINIYESQRRWLSFGYAVLGLVIVFVAYVLMVFAVAKSTDPMTVAAINKISDACAWIQLLPSAIGASIPPRRAKHG